MRLESTNQRSPAVSFREALFGGLAPDGGLYLPAAWPSLTLDDLRAWRGLPFADVAVRLAGRFLAGELDADVMERLVRDALNFPAPVVEVEPGRLVLELFHGPTQAFKDFGARFLARFFSHILAEQDDRATILVATSGDTGSAVARGFHLVPRIDVVVLYPKGRVSAFQESQMATLGGNVTAVRVSGSFDDCQRLVKTALLDPELSALRLSSANSINIGRLLPQMFYYVSGYLSSAATPGDPVVFSVPTGNVGNLTAGAIAARLGVPIARLVAATNANRVLPDYLETGTYRPRPSIATISNAMDVGDPSNVARLVALYGGSIEALRRHLFAVSITEKDTRATIRRVFAHSGYVLDPHSAVAWAAADDFARQVGAPPPPIVTLATAHPAKFDAVIRQELGMAPPLPDDHAGWEHRPLQAVDLDAFDYDGFRQLLRSKDGSMPT